ncbi:discoidin domain-containing protein [Sphingobacterium kyonggiense]
MKRSSKHITSYLLLAVLLLFLSSSIFSCKKESFGLLDEVSNEFNHYPNSTVGKATAMKVGDLATNNRTLFAPGLPILLNERASADIQVQGNIDVSLISIYDSLNHVKSPVFSEGAFELENNGLITVKEGYENSTDSLKVLLKDASKLTNNTVYLIPIKLQVQSGNASLKSRYMFVKMHVEISPVMASMGSFKYEGKFYSMNDRRYSFIGGNLINTRINGVNDGIKTIRFTSKINHSLDKEFQSSVKISSSDSIFKFFEKIKFSTYKKIPVEAIKVLKDKVKFPAESYVSQDSFNVQIDYNQLKASDTSYLAVFELENKSMPNLLTPNETSAAKYAFVVVKVVEYNTGNIALTTNDLEGVEMNRSTWKISGKSHADFPVTNLLDGKIETYWQGIASPPQEFVIDMGKAETLKGFKFTPQYKSTYNDFQKVEVYVSSDGTTWKKEGLFIAGEVDYRSNPQRPDYKKLKFLTPVTARYFKFNVIESYLGVTAIADLDGIQ